MSYEEKFQIFVFEQIEEFTGYKPNEADLDKTFDCFGLTSVQGVLFVGEFEDEFDIDLPNNMLVSNYTLRAWIKKASELSANT